MNGKAGRTDNSLWAFLALLAVFLVLTLLYNASIPLYESPDELQHAAFVVWLADGHGLPVVDPQDPGPWEQEGTQPPLYYWIVARLAGYLPHDEARNLAKLNPAAAIGDPLRPDNKNRVVHDLEAERWPYRGTTLFVHTARFVSTLMALGSLVAIYCLGRIVLPDRPGIAVGAMGLVAFTPQFLFLSTSVNNDNMVILIASWVLVLLASWMRTDRLPGWPSLAGLGILLGVAALAKFSGLLLWPLACGVIIWLAWRHKGLRWLIPAGALIFGLALAICGWWLLRNLQLYGELSGISTHLAVIGTRRRFPSRLPALLAEFRGLRYSFWALFGWFNVLAPDPFYWLVDALTVLGIAGFGLFLVRSLRHRPRWTGPVLLMLFIWIGLVAVALLRWTRMTSASQGRLLYPALAAIALVLVIGWAELLPNRLRRPVGIVGLVAWALCAALVPFLVIKPAYALPQRANPVNAHRSASANSGPAFSARTLHVRFGDCCELVGYVPPGEPVQAGDRVPLTLIWQALKPAGQDYTLFVHATAADGQRVGQLDTYHGGGMYPTSQWQPGEFITDTVYVPITRKAQGPTLVRFNVGLYERASRQELPAFAPDGSELEAVWAGEAALEPFEWPQPPVRAPVEVDFDGRIRLAGVDLSQTHVRPGQVVTATLYWEALDRVTEDYTGFIHLIDTGGQTVAQDDHPPLNGRYPTRLWSPGTLVADDYRLELPEGMEEGTYELLAGFYHPGTGQRLPAVLPQTGERWKDDLASLGVLVVTAPAP